MTNTNTALLTRQVVIRCEDCHNRYRTAEAVLNHRCPKVKVAPA